MDINYLLIIIYIFVFNIFIVKNSVAWYKNREIRVFEYALLNASITINTIFVYIVDLFKRNNSLESLHKLLYLVSVVLIFYGTIKINKVRKELFNRQVKIQMVKNNKMSVKKLNNNIALYCLSFIVIILYICI